MHPDLDADPGSGGGGGTTCATRTPRLVTRAGRLVLAHALQGADRVWQARQHVNLLGYALMVNSLALHEHRQRRRLTEAA